MVNSYMESEQIDPLHQVLEYCVNITDDLESYLRDLAYKSDREDTYGKPMPYIGMYIALASLFCILAMVVDLLHGLRNRKLWFPCNYFTLNAASLAVIAVAIKLPNDLTSIMPSHVDRTAKLGSLSFICTMMANLLPSLATMESEELVSNMIALGILVITLVVNVCIQLNTGVLSYNTSDDLFSTQIGHTPLGVLLTGPRFIAAIYVGMLLMLLIIYACSSLAILRTRQTLETNYQAAYDQTALNDLELPQKGRLIVKKLKQHVSNYWIMAVTASPQFMTVCYATTCASGVICVISTALHIYIIIPYNIKDMEEYETNYKWSTLMILVIQFIGVILGTLAPIFRCFAALSFKLSGKWIWNHIKVFKVESYWTHKLSDWKNRSKEQIPQRSIPIPFSSRRGKIVIKNLKMLFFSICIEFQETVVVACKMIAVIPLLLLICVSYCWKWLKDMFSSSAQNPHGDSRGSVQDDIRYVLQLEDDMELAKRTLEGMSKWLNHLIQKAEKKQPKNLMKLLAESKGFEGVEKFDSHHVPSEYLNCWRLPLVTLTAIAISLRDVLKDKVDDLVSGVSEGIVYVTHVEESLNATHDHEAIQKVAKTLWLEVELGHKWLGNKLPNPANTAGQVLQWLRDISKDMVPKVASMENDDSKHRSISANSMYRITETLLQTFLPSHHANIDHVSQEELLIELSSMIADILAACLTNIPLVIAKKCHAREIEKREASVHEAAQLLGKTTHIINTLQDRELPDGDELPYIDKWRAYLKSKHPGP